MAATDPTALRPSVYRGAAKAVLLQWSMRLIGLVSVFILARLLAPEDFGVLGLAVATLALVELLGAVGLRQALLRIREPDRAHYDTAWTIQIILFVAMGLAALALAPVAGSFYGQPVLTPVIAALSLRFFFSGFINIGIIEFDRNFEFGRDLRMRISSRIAAFAVTVTAAFVLQNYWALVIGLIAQSAFHTAASYIAHPYRPRLSLARRTELLGTSIWIFASAVAQTVQMQIERLVLGRFATAHLVGLYSVSKDLAEIFTQEIATALNRVTFVTVAQSRRPLEESSARTAQILGAYAMIAAPMAFGLAATAEDSVYVLLGAQWSAAAPFLRIVAVSSGFYAVYKVIASSLQAGGYARGAAFLSGGGALFLTLAVVAVAALYPDAIILAWTAFAANLAILLSGTFAFARLSGTGVTGLCAHVFRPFAAGALMFLIVRALGAETGHVALDLLASVALGMLAYPLLLLVLWIAWGRPAGAEAEALSLAGRGGRGVLAALSGWRRSRRQS